MAGIYIESKLDFNLVVFGYDLGGIDVSNAIAIHTYLVYRDDAGNEWVIRGGPRSYSHLFGGWFDFQINVEMELSADLRGGVTAAERNSRMLNFDGKTADEVWNLMVKYARQIENAAPDYQVLYQNSNTFIATLIEAAGRDPEESLPNNTSNLVAWSNYALLLTDIEPPEDGIIRGDDNANSYTGMQTAETIYGKGGNDVLFGKAGNDWIYGEGGNDTLLGGDDSDVLDGGIGDDRLKGDAGNDYLGSGLIISGPKAG